MLLLGVQSPPRVQGTKRLPERGAQRALHQGLVIGSGHVPTQEQHRVCSQLRGGSVSEDPAPRGGSGGLTEMAGRTLQVRVSRGNCGVCRGLFSLTPPPHPDPWLLHRHSLFGLETFCRKDLSTIPAHAAAGNCSSSNFYILCEGSVIHICPHRPGPLANPLPRGPEPSSGVCRHRACTVDQLHQVCV